MAGKVLLLIDLMIQILGLLFIDFILTQILFKNLESGFDKSGPEFVLFVAFAGLFGWQVVGTVLKMVLSKSWKIPWLLMLFTFGGSYVFASFGNFLKVEINHGTVALLVCSALAIMLSVVQTSLAKKKV
jgi:hypothetical protein